MIYETDIAAHKLTYEIINKHNLSVESYYISIYCFIHMAIGVGFDIGRKLHNGSKPIFKLDRNGKFLAYYPSLSAAANDNNIGVTGISKVCLEERIFAGGFKWRFVDPNEYYKKRKL